MFLGKTVNFTVSLLLSKSINGYWQNVREAMMKCWGLVSGPWGVVMLLATWLEYSLKLKLLHSCS